MLAEIFFPARDRSSNLLPLKAIQPNNPPDGSIVFLPVGPFSVSGFDAWLAVMGNQGSINEAASCIPFFLTARLFCVTMKMEGTERFSLPLSLLGVTASLAGLWRERLFSCFLHMPGSSKPVGWKHRLPADGSFCFSHSLPRESASAAIPLLASRSRGAMPCPTT